MGDVDLRVDVTKSGTVAAIKAVNDLRKGGVGAGTALRNLAAASKQSAQDFGDAYRGAVKAGDAIKGFGTAVNSAKAATGSLAVQLKTLERGYRDIAAVNVGSSPLERLIEAGDGDLSAGKAIARQTEALGEAFKANIVKDKAAVERQEQQLLTARTDKLGAMAAVERATWESSLAGMTATERAAARLARAEQELAIANKAVNQSFIQQRGAGGRFLPFTVEQLQGQTAALNTQAGAMRNLSAAQKELARAQESAHNDSNAFQSSYSYFILAGLASQAAAKIYEVGKASLTASMEIERSFADVDRTFDGTASQLEALRNKLTELSTSTPNSFTDLAQIAALGNQLGVAAQDIQTFTTTIAQYTAISGQSAEDSATAFGKISNLTGLAASQYSNLASAITYVARTSVATEATIQRTATEITALASGAGFSADAIVGLAGALSSLAIPPERARGALSLYFGALNTAVAEGGPKLAAFAELTNMSADALEKMVRENRGQEVFTAFISGLSDLDNVAKTTALDTLGLSTIRVDQTMRALSQNVPLVTDAFAGANKAFTENTEISRQYATIQETLNSAWIEFQSAVQNAAGALGDSFAPEAKAALKAITDVLVKIQEFTNTPVGAAIANAAAKAAVLIAALAAMVGVLALAKASMVVFAFAMSGIGWSSASKGMAGWIASLFSADLATRKAAASTVGFRVALAETTAGMTAASVGARALAVGMSLLKVALPILAISAAIALFDSLTDRVEKAIDPSKKLSADLSGLKEALLADNQGLLPKAIDDTGTAASSTNLKVSEFNQSILAAIAMQERAEGAVSGTNNAIDSQAFALGDASKAWIEDALKGQEDLKDIIEGSDPWETFMETVFQPGSADEITSRENFKKMVNGGLDINELSQIAITEGEDAAKAAYDAWQKGYAKENPDEAIASTTFGALVLPGILESVVDAYGDAAVEAALSGKAIEETGVVAVGTAADFDTFGNYIGSAIEQGEAVAVTFSGVTSELEEFRSAIQGAIAGSVGFDSVLARANDAAQAVADAYNELHKGADMQPLEVDATAFGDSLTSATDEALKFYSDIMTLAETGNTSFALQLAELGPEAQGILSSTLTLDGAGQQKLEAAARFAAFLASDAFKNELQTQMDNANEAYAIIFKATGDLNEVKEYIAAQLAGTGEEYEKKWAVDHPKLPLNFTPELEDPSDAQLAIYSAELSGKLTISPNIAYDPGTGQTSVGSNTYTDKTTGNTITLPATLNTDMLTAALGYWLTNQNASPEQIIAALNTAGFPTDIETWKSTYGPIELTGRVNVVGTPIVARGSQYDFLFKTSGSNQLGGEISTNRFATGGQYGQFRGPGSGTSDSILARVSNGEFINTSASTKFWGTDFFDSLNRKMLPTSFLNMLGAAAGAGASGPTHVAHVSLVQQNPLTRDPLVQLREDSEKLVAGIWGG